VLAPVRHGILAQEAERNAYLLLTLAIRKRRACILLWFIHRISLSAIFMSRRKDLRTERSSVISISPFIRPNAKRWDVVTDETG